MSRKYETIVIVNPNLGETDSKAELKRLQDLLVSKGAESLEMDLWAKRDFAYMIEGHQHGSYCCFTYESSNSGIIEFITNQLRISEKVIKFQSHKIASRSRKFKGNLKKIQSRTTSDLDDDQLSY